MTRRARRLRYRAEVGWTRPPAARALVAALAVSLVLGSAPALAQGPGPERPPVKAATKLSPDPAPVAAKATAPAPQATAVAPPATPPPAAVLRSTPARSPIARSTNTKSATRPAPKARRARAKAQAAKAAKKRPPTIGRVKRAALGATRAEPAGSDRLLFLGGVALLVLVLGDAGFLTLSARVLRDPVRR